MQLSSLSPINFQGIYKIKASGISNVTSFLKEHEYVYRYSGVFKENNNNYIYVITDDGKLPEKLFEADLTAKKIPFWKSFPVNQILNKKIIESLFDITKRIQNKENWIV